MISFGTGLSVYLIIGFCFGVFEKIRANHDPHYFTEDNESLKQFVKNTSLYLLVATLFGTMALIYFFFIRVRAIIHKMKRKELPITVRGEELIVWAEVGKSGRFLVNSLSLHHESLDFLNELADEEFDEWVEEIRQALNENYAFEREVLFLHLAEI